MLARLADTRVATPPVRGDGSGLRYEAPGVSRAGPEVSEGSRCSAGFWPAGEQLTAGAVPQTAGLPVASLDIRSLATLRVRTLSL